MTPDERKLATLTMLRELLPSKNTISEGALALFVKVLDRFSAEEVESAAAAGVEKWEWFPTPALFVKEIEGSAEQRSESAWADIRRQVREVGYYGRPRLTAEQQEAVSRLGGWEHLCSCTSVDLDWHGRHFAEVYEGASRHIEERLAIGEQSELKQLEAGR